MSEPNLAKAQALVMAWRFPLPSYSPYRTCSHTRRVLLALILAASYSLSFSPPAPSLTSYSSRCIVQLPAVCHSESCANHVTKLAIILATSYLQSYSPGPTCYRPRCRRPHRYPPHRRRAHRVVLITSCSSRRAHHVMLIVSCSTRRVVFANFPFFPREVW